MIRILALIISFTLFTHRVFSQKKNQNFQLKIRKASGVIVIDGIPGDAGWSDADSTTDFFMVLPMDTSRAKVRTVVRMTYDEHHLYLLASCYNGLPGPHMVESMRRDWEFLKNDNFLLFIDTFDDQTNGFTFGANAAV